MNTAKMSLDEMRVRLQDRINVLQGRLNLANKYPGPKGQTEDLKYELKIVEKRLKLLNEKILLGRTQ